MNHNGNDNDSGTDRDLARMFDEQRREDERAAPDFRTLLSKQTAAPRRSARALLLRASAAALLVAGILTLLPSVDGRRQIHGSRDFALPESAASLGSWKAPTDFLLDTPGADLLRQQPDLLANEPAAVLPLQPSDEKLKGVSR